MATLEIDQRTVDQLSALAAANGMTPEAYLKLLLSSPGAGDSTRISSVELEALLDEHVFDGPTLPADFARADIYAEHD